MGRTRKAKKPARGIAPPWMPERLIAPSLAPYAKLPFFKPLLYAGAWYERTFSRPARLLILVELIALLFSTLTLNSPILPFALFLLALFAADFLSGQIFRPKLRIERRLPHRAKQGVPFSISYEMENMRKRPAFDLLLDPFLASPDLVRIAGNEYCDIAGRASLSVKTDYLPLRRGSFPIPQGIAESIFPFHLFKRACVFGKQETLIVHPPCFLLRNLAAAAGSVLPYRDTASAPKPGDSMDLFGCRSYRNGDPMRKIHWKATARNNKLIVKEFQQEQVSRAGILLDPHLRIKRSARDVLAKLLIKRDPPPDKRFEAAVSLCASIADTLASMDVQAEFLAIGTRIHAFEPSRGERINLRLLDLLATVEPSARDPFRNRPPDFSARIRASGIVFFVTARWDDSIRELLRDLDEPGCKTALVLVGDGGTPPDAPQSVLSASPDSILNGGDVL